MKMYIALAMSYDKKDAESLIFGQGFDLFLHTLKYMIHVDSFDGEYNYWTKDVISTVLQITDKALNLKWYKQLKRSIATDLLFKHWKSDRLALTVRGIYQDPHYKKNVKTLQNSQ